MRRELVAAAASRYHGDLCRGAAVMVGEEWAEDMVQEAYVRALRWGPNSVRDAKSWIFIVVRNLCRDHLSYRNDRLGSRTHSIDRRYDVCGPVSVLDECLDVEHALASVDRDQRDALMLVATGHSYREVAARQGIGTGAAKMRVCRARKHLRAAVAAAIALACALPVSAQDWRCVAPQFSSGFETAARYRVFAGDDERSRHNSLDTSIGAGLDSLNRAGPEGRAYGVRYALRLECAEWVDLEAIGRMDTVLVTDTVVVEIPTAPAADSSTLEAVAIWGIINGRGLLVSAIPEDLIWVPLTGATFTARDPGEIRPVRFRAPVPPIPVNSFRAFLDGAELTPDPGAPNEFPFGDVFTLAEGPHQLIINYFLWTGNAVAAAAAFTVEKVQEQSLEP